MNPNLLYMLHFNNCEEGFKLAGNLVATYVRLLRESACIFSILFLVILPNLCHSQYHTRMTKEVLDSYGEKILMISLNQV